MSSAINSDIENPYYHLRNAEQAELAGELDTAEMAYKAAVMAADNLPLADHRRNYEQELSRIHNSAPRFGHPSQGVDLNEMNEAYSRLLNLPLHTRLRLGTLLYVRGNLKEARAIYDEAAEIGIDSLNVESVESKRLMGEAQKLQQTLARVGEQEVTAQYISMSNVLRARTMKKSGPIPTEIVALSDLYSQLNIGELWAHRRSGQHAASGTAAPPVAGAEPLTTDASSLLSDMYAAARSFVNDLISSGRCPPQGFTWTDPVESDEHWQSVDAYGKETSHLVRSLRCRISDRYWSFSMRGDLSGAVIELYLIPTHELLNPVMAETDSTLRARFRFDVVGGLRAWTSSGFPVYIDEARASARSVIKEIIQRAEEFSGGQTNAESSVDFSAGGNMMKKVIELSQQKAGLAEKLVYRHESLQNRIARDIHDAVIADVLAVKRAFSEGGVPLSPKEIVVSLDAVAERLRNICQDLSTRDLQDWGLKTVMRDVLERVGDRCKAQWSLNCEGELPTLQYEVELHLYRIIQECLNNIEKYAKATRIQILVTQQNGVLSVTVQDDGVGFDTAQRTTRKANEGGMGLNTIRERVALIQCFHPAQVWIQSEIGKGTKTTVQINLGRKEPSK